MSLALWQLIIFGVTDTYVKYSGESESEGGEEYRLITTADKNQECPITLCNIERGGKYCICSTCKHNFSAGAVAAIKKNTFAMKCPLCRSPWTKADKRIYINNLDAEDELQDAVRFALKSPS